MKRVDRLNALDIRRLQDAKLASLVDRLRSNPFYADRLANLDAKADRGSLADIPTIQKPDLLADQESHQPYGNILSVDPGDVVETHLTSGTSGRAREVHALTHQDVAVGTFLTSIAYEWAGLRRGDAAGFNAAIGNSAAGQVMYRAIRAIGRTPMLIGSSGFEERYRVLQRYPFVGLYGLPSAINGLARTAKLLGGAGSLPVPGLRFILISGESYPVEWALRTQETWGAALFEAYGATQTGSAISAATCEQGAVVDGARGVLHLFEWSFHFEIVDPTTLQPVELGEFGELVVTTLDKQASPLLRFKTGDRVRYMGKDCACGRELMTIEAGTIGRYDDMFKIKGNNVWAAEMERTLFSFSDVQEFRGVVKLDAKGRDNLFLYISTRSGVNRESLDVKIVETFKERFGFRPLISYVDLSDLPEWHSPERKARRFEDERAAHLATEGQT